MEMLSVVYLIVCAYHVMEAVPLEHKLTFSDDDLKCIQDLKLDKNYIESIVTNHSSGFPPEDDPQFNEYFHCHWKIRGIQNEDGTVNYGKIVEAIQRIPQKRFGGIYDAPVGLGIATVAVENCKNIPKGESHGQTAVKVHNCIEKRVIEFVKKIKDVLVIL